MALLQHDAARSRTLAWLEDDPRPLDWNGPADRPFARIRDDDLQRPIIEHVERVARLQPGHIAISDSTLTLTFGELWDAVSGLAETLGVETQPGDLVGILLPESPMFSVAMLACLACGRPFVAFDSRYSADWLDQVVRDARPTRIVTTQEAPSGARVIRLDSVPKRARSGWRPTPARVDDPACVLFTSGSSGRPKGIVNSQRNLLQRIAQSINSAHLNDADRLLTLAAPSTIVAVRDILTALVAGAHIHLVDPHGAGAREILHIIRSDATTVLFAFPALLRSIVTADTGRAGASLRLLRVGGDTTLWSDIDRWRAWLPRDAAIQIVYAATEAPMMQWFVDDGARRDDQRVPIGYPLPGNHLALVDAAGREPRPGEVGELIVGSRYVALGRWVDGRLADEHVEAAGEGERVFATGDLVMRRPDGLLERVGRADRQVKIRGARVDLEGVEALLATHPGVRDAAVVARPDGIDGAVALVAYVTARSDAHPALVGELHEVVAAAPPEMRPSRLHLVPAIPRLPNSKLDTRALAGLDSAHAQLEREQSGGQFAVSAHGDHVSEALARVWEQVLLVPVHSGDDDFFDSGGDSLKAIGFVIELERALGIEIPLTLISEAPTFGALSAALRERHAPASTLLVTLKPGDGRPSLFFIHGVGGNVTEIMPTARRVTYPGPVIGIRARGLVRGEVPHTSIEAMAADYLDAIRARQPQGPYHLCGYSSGGIVAFEIARRLAAAGEEVGLVGLFDTTMSPVRWPLRTWASIIARRMAAPRISLEQLRTWRSALGPVASLGIRVTARALLASARYHPGFYEGTLTLFSPAEREPSLPPLASVWRKHARSVVEIETEGTHATMLSTRHAESTAAHLTRCLVSPGTTPADTFTAAVERSGGMAWALSSRPETSPAPPRPSPLAG